MVTLNLSERDSRNAVLRVLKSCDLPTTYVDNITSTPPPKKSDPFAGPQKKSPAWQKYESMFKDNDDAQIIRGMVRRAKEDESLLYVFYTHFCLLHKNCVVNVSLVFIFQTMVREECRRCC